MVILIGSIRKGEKSEKVFLFVHGFHGNKEEALAFAEVAVPKGYQVLFVSPILDMKEFVDDLSTREDDYYGCFSVKRLPNDISAFRIAGSIGLLFCNVSGLPFWTLYVLCGFSDMADGWLARKLHAETEAGAIWDSVADIVFVACCATRLLPVLEIPAWLWIWAGAIVIIKMVNQISALFVCKRFCFLHTVANKLTGLLLFLTVPALFWSMIPIAIVAAMATFAAVQEGHFIRTKQVF